MRFSDGIDKKDYAALLEDLNLTIGAFLEIYGEDGRERLQAALCAMATHTAAKDAAIEGYSVLTAADLYGIIEKYGYMDVFEDVNLERFTPSDRDLSRLFMAMCKAETDEGIKDPTGGIV